MKIDLLLKGGQFFNAFLKRFVEGDIAVKNGKIFLQVLPASCLSRRRAWLIYRE